jgi:hypothetical protein
MLMRIWPPQKEHLCPTRFVEMRELLPFTPYPTTVFPLTLQIARHPYSILLLLWSPSSPIVSLLEVIGTVLELTFYYKMSPPLDERSSNTSEGCEQIDHQDQPSQLRLSKACAKRTMKLFANGLL